MYFFITLVSDYVCVSREKYGYNSEQALGMLYWHHHDMDKALNDLANFAPLPDDWTTEDKVTFEAAFNSTGKNFVRIKQMVLNSFFCTFVKLCSCESVALFWYYYIN